VRITDGRGQQSYTYSISHRVRGELRTGPCLGLSAGGRLKGMSKDCQWPTAAPDE